MKKFELWYRANGNDWRKSEWIFEGDDDGNPNLISLGWAVVCCCDREVIVNRRGARYGFRDPYKGGSGIVEFDRVTLERALIERRASLRRRELV